MRELLANPEQIVALSARRGSSKAFLALFREGMLLVEDVAEYLDGVGRDEVKSLSRGVAISYATESMRLTTRLMQLTSWLLLQRAENSGELSSEQSFKEKSKVRLDGVGSETPDDILSELPQTLQKYILQTRELNRKLVHLDKNLQQEEIFHSTSPALSQLASLSAAFSRE